MLHNEVQRYKLPTHMCTTGSRREELNLATFVAALLRIIRALGHHKIAADAK